MAFEVHADDGIPFLLARGEHHPIAEEPRVVHEHVEATEGVDRGVDEAVGAVPVGDVVGVRDRLTAGGDDLVDHLLRGAAVGAGSVTCHAEVVHDDAGALAGEGQGVLAPDAAGGAGDDDDPSFADARHVPVSFAAWVRHPTGAR